MLSFTVLFALAYAATLLLAAAVGHMVRFGNFLKLVREHGLVPPTLSSPVAGAVVGLELLVGAAAVFSLSQFADHGIRIAVLAAAAMTGGAFHLYVQQLLRKSSSASSCGCSPWSAPLTRASLAPSIGAVSISVCGLVAAAASQDSLGALGVLPGVWGLVFAGMTMLYPAAVLQLPSVRET
jgi:hypothetical protein